jgi:hypothetical protein
MPRAPATRIALVRGDAVAWDGDDEVDREAARFEDIVGSFQVAFGGMENIQPLLSFGAHPPSA